ncbi:MAG: VWA domain-containing protein [candidate division KSB1 bacterium]|nr:VWA domain-containing protein [candidate division KSB1 bacterium]
MKISMIKFWEAAFLTCLLILIPYKNQGFAQENRHGNPIVTRWVDPAGSKPMSFQQWISKTLSAPLTTDRIYQSSPVSKPKIMILVNGNLYPAVRSQVDQYIADLESQNYEVVLVTISGGTPQNIRSMLQNEPGLVGAVLIGSLPVPWFQIIETFDGGKTYQYEEFPCDLYYMDLNGTWADTKHYDSVSKSFVNGSDGILESHTGAVAPDIWIGRLMASTLTSGNEVNLVNNYFTKNHLYRTAKTSIQTRALTYLDDDWSNWTTCGLDCVYNSITVVNDKEVTRAPDYKNRLDDNYLWIHLCAHSWPGGHGFKYNNGTNWDYVYVNDVRTIDPLAYFYNLFACSNARYIEENYMAGWYIFMDSYGLGAVGSTKTGSMLSFEDFYDPLAEGATLGDAFKNWFTKRAEGGFEDWEQAWFYGMTYLGDPALTCGSPYTLPELVGKNISFNPNSASPGTNITFTSTIANEGNKRAGQFHFNYYISTDNSNFSYANASFLGSDMIDFINGLSSKSSTTTLQIPPSVTAGQYYVWIVIDPLYEVIEAYEYNNKFCSTLPLQITSGYTIFDDFEDGNANGWLPKTRSRWSVVLDQGDYSHFLNTSNYTNDERSIISGYEFFDFDLNVKIKSPENFSSNPGANYVIWFGFRDEDNYYYLRFDHLNYENKLFRHYQGGNTVIATYNGMTINDNNYHLVRVVRSGSQIKVYFDGVQVMTANDNYLPGGKIALGSYNDAVYFDDVGIIGGSPLSINITAPIGGEKLTVGQPFNITWSASSSISQIRIDLSLDGGANWSNLTPNAANTGSWIWTPQPQQKSPNCKIRLRDALDSTVVRVSNSFQVIDPNVYTAIQVPSSMAAPTIDGVLNEAVWNYADKDSLLFGDTENWGQRWTRWNDNLVIWRAVWSPTTNRLYVAVEVKDDIRGTFDDTNPNVSNYYPWNDESIEFFTDGDNNGGSYNGRYDIAQQWRVSGQNIRNLNNYPSATSTGIYTGNDFITAVQQGPQGNWICEAMFTIYNVLPSQPRPLVAGDMIGWEIWYNDSDNETWENGHYVRDHQTGWKYLGPAYGNANYFGDLLLGPVPHDSLLVTINQIDATGFPAIRSYVSVSDLGGNAIVGLNENNFLVKEDGVRELPITVTPYGGAQKVNVGFAMDYSGSMTTQAIKDMETAAHTFVNLMEANDEGAVFKFSSYVQKMIGFTADKNALHSAINASFPGAGYSTALYDAIYNAISEAIGKSGRKAVLALTDGKDNASSHNIDQTIAHANQYSTPVFTIGLGSSIDETVLKKIASQTGGEYYRAPSSNDLEAIYKKISEYLRNQYLITYTTHNPNRDGRWRHVFVQANYLNAVGSDTAGYLAPPTDSLLLWIAKNHQGPSGGIITIPVKIGPLANKQIFSVGLTISYNPQILQAIHANTSNTVAQNWGAPTYDITTGKITIGMAGSSALPDSGSLVNIVFNILGSAGQTTSLHFVDALLNEGIPPVKTSDGLFRVSTQFSISGKIGYYSDFATKPIKNAMVHLSGTTSASTQTDNTGYYEFTNLGQLFYKTKPSRDGDLRNSVTPYDASLVLQSSVGLISLTPYQKIAADVSDNGSVTPFDASYILRFYVGDISGFPVGDDWKFVPSAFAINDNNWSSAPDSIIYAPLNRSETNQNYLGIIYGDVSGNWTPAPMGMAKSQAEPPLSSLLNLEPIYGLPGTIIEVPFESHQFDNVSSFGVLLTFKSVVFKFKELVLSDQTQRWTLCYRHHGDTLKFAMAGSEPIFGSATLITARFEISATVNSEETHDLTIRQLSINELQQLDASARIQYIAKSTIPSAFQLYQNRPNPFNAATEIRFELPEPGHVILKIYNLQGQEVRTLLDEPRPAGYHSVSFDGRSDDRHPLTSGLYVYQIRCGSQSISKKMLLVQ